MADKPKKEKVANRLYIDSQGAKVDDETNAQGVRYEHLERKENVVAMWGDFNADGQRLVGLFGLKTWIGNLFNQDLDLAEVEARLAEVKSGKWPEREGVGGPRYDAAVLAASIAEAKKAPDPAPFLKRITEEKGYGAMALKVPAVQHLYNTKMGKAVTIDQL